MDFKDFLCFFTVMSAAMLCAKLGSYLFRKLCAAAISKGRVFTLTALTNHRKNDITLNSLVIGLFLITCARMAYLSCLYLKTHFQFASKQGFEAK